MQHTSSCTVTASMYISVNALAITIASMERTVTINVQIGVQDCLQPKSDVGPWPAINIFIRSKTLVFQ